MKSPVIRLTCALSCALLGMVVGCRRDHQQAAIGDLYEEDFAFTVDDYLRAAKQGRAEVLRWYLLAGMQVDAENQFGERALGLAAERAHTGAVLLLLEAGAGPEVEGPGGRTPLLGAAEAGDAKAVAALLERKVDPLHRDHENWNALRLAAFYGHRETVGLLIAHYGAEELDSAMLLAALAGRVGVLDRLLSAGADVYQRTPERQTALMLAAISGHFEAVRILLQHGANRFSTDPQGRTAALLASEAEQFEAEALLRRDARGELAGAVLPELQGSDVEPPGTIWRADGARLDGDPEAEQPIGFVRYREEQLPVALQSVEPDKEAAALRLLYGDHRVIRVAVGGVVPGTPFAIVRVNRRLAAGKDIADAPIVLHSATVRDMRSGREFDMTPEDPGLSTYSYVDLVDAGGRTFRARRGDSFRIGSGERQVPFRILELRPREVLVERLDTGAVLTVAKRR